MGIIDASLAKHVASRSAELAGLRRRIAVVHAELEAMPDRHRWPDAARERLAELVRLTGERDALLS